jgi:pimeloyl-ACP methyl ester carboxylesterase
VERSTTASGLFCGTRLTSSAVTVVFVHGAMDRGAAFLRCARNLSGVSWIVYDRRGYGRSHAGHTPTFDTHRNDLIDVLEDERNRSGGSTVVVGHSVGGTLALAAAAARPDLVDSLVVHECPIPWMPWSPSRINAGRDGATEAPKVSAERFMRSIIGDAAWEALPSTTRLQRLGEGLVLQSELVSESAPHLFELTDVACPVVLGRSTDAPDHRIATTNHLHAELVRSEVMLIENAPHGAHSLQPDDFAQLVNRSCELACADDRHPIHPRSL